MWRVGVEHWFEEEEERLTWYVDVDALLDRTSGDVKIKRGEGTFAAWLGLVFVITVVISGAFFDSKYSQTRLNTPICMSDM